MPPAWVRSGFGPSTDQDLRELQLRWFRDDLWMRRLIFLVCIAAFVTSLVILLFGSPSTWATGLAAGTGLVSGPAAYYFGRATDRAIDSEGRPVRGP